MPAGTRRDVDALEPALLGWLRHRHPERADLRVDSLRHASAGLSNETVLLRASWTAAGGRCAESLALRLPAVQMTFPDFDLATQARVQETVAAAGVPAPAPVVLETDDRWLGVQFLAMPFVAGDVGPQAAAFDPWIRSLPPQRRRRVCDAFVDLLARLHNLDVPATGLDRVLRGAGRTLADELTWWEEYVRWAGNGDEPPPVLVELLAWCQSHLPRTEPDASLLWGDPRLGNAIFDDEQRVVAALDWDMSFLGPAEHDLAWYLGLEEVTNRVAGGAATGFPERAETIARYEDGLGRAVVDLAWYEIFALVRSIAISVRQGRLAAEAGVEYLVPAPDRSPVVARVRELIAAFG